LRRPLSPENTFRKTAAEKKTTPLQNERKRNNSFEPSVIRKVNGRKKGGGGERVKDFNIYVAVFGLRCTLARRRGLGV